MGRKGAEGEKDDDWLAVDCFDLVVHFMMPGKLYYVMSCHVMLNHVMLCHVMSSCVVLCSDLCMLYHDTSCDAMLHSFYRVYDINDCMTSLLL